MHVHRIALGVIQDKGRRTIPPTIVSFGRAEADFLARHVGKVRDVVDASSRNVFRDSTQVASMLHGLLTVSDVDFTAAAADLQSRLASTMRASTNPRDCVFGVLVTGPSSSPSHATVLKLDAVLEAAETSISAGRVTLKVLQKLIPEPGKLQKAMSWPDDREGSDVIMIDTNASQAQYFENAFDVLTSPRSNEAESQLHQILVESVDESAIQDVLASAATKTGPADVVMEELAEEFPSLREAAQSLQTSERPAGHIRPNKLAARPVIWRADDVEVRVPPHRADAVTVERANDGEGWVLTVHSRSRPQPGS